MQLTNNRIYVKPCLYTVPKFRDYFFKSNGSRYFKVSVQDKRASFFLKFRLYGIESTQTCIITTNNYLSFKTDST